MAQASAQLLFDESGQPFIVMREQENQKRITGVEAVKVNSDNFLFDFEKIIL